jgi:hypothetical protein
MQIILFQVSYGNKNPESDPIEILFKYAVEDTQTPNLDLDNFDKATYLRGEYFQ